MARRRRPLLPPPPQLVWLAVLFSAVAPAVAKTDKSDVAALNVMFDSMNKPSQLSGWKSSGGDPCGDDEEWKGIECSGSSVTEINLSGLGLSGSLGYQLSSLKSVTKFDVSNNNLKGDLPYQLPPNVVQLNLYGNSFTGGVPYSISQMEDLETLNVGKNHLSGQLTDMFSQLSKLSTLDLSFNRFSGSLPQSFQHLKDLKTLNLESNQFSGHIDVLGKLPLEDLNLQNNKFTGWIPSKLKDISNLQIGGNQWSSGSAPPGMEKGSAVGGSSGGGGGGGINGIVIAAIVIAVLLAALILLSVLKRNHTSSASSHYIMDDSGHNRSFTPLVDDAINMKPLEHSSSISSRTPSAMPSKSISDNEFENKLNYSRRTTDPINLVTYSSSDLQAATGSFHSSRLLGQGTIGGVFKAKYADGRVLAVKKFDPLSFSGSSDFMDLVNSISKLRHPNISELVGYCSEPGHYMLVYDYNMNGSLYDFLHLSDDYSKPLTWDTRVRIAVGTACALEYLHDVCSPPMIHKNIKASNVLLDADLNPRLTDCGLAYFYEDTSQSLGPGYDPPECTSSSGYVMKSDVYCFGVVMLQLLTGQKPYDSSKPRAEQSLVKFVTPQLHDINALEALADPALRGLYPPKALSRFADVLARCVQSDPEFRPSMSEVVQSLLQCVQRSTSNRRLGGLRSVSQRSDDSDW
ncbi:protein STRUBBELIG-RECEPTOR FAMILY 5 isoform X2 [Sorghum bicolor]|uniref:protein STRUBBELIG-RECEPTOR FAMILY 5 isoform X2 n=1 Tax=Sorghum bicolor TaxID=4558 RepID=UPI000B425929|nr:protein STRUBBELIG-RECEPTOR FAMILY 5 isoform X2 [Sorghum bicolor]|eukprot:XP_021308945.1 protein STRUBBELIG-RECEPTOR FAMILY 5 isoform X2 [Sorghum bicolor]